MVFDQGTFFQKNASQLTLSFESNGGFDEFKPYAIVGSNNPDMSFFVRTAQRTNLGRKIEESAKLAGEC